jgi:hypothetical protein
MAFPTGAISLWDVLGPNGYNTASKDMATLNGRIYYDPDGTPRTIYCSPGNPFSLGTLRGKYKQIQIGTLNGSGVTGYNENIARTVWDFGLLGRAVSEDVGVDGNAGFNNTTYTYVNGRLLSVNIQAFFNSNRRGTFSDGSFVYNKFIQIKVDGRTVVRQNGTGWHIGFYGGTINNGPYRVGPISSTLEITITATVRNTGGGGIPGDKSCNVGGTWRFTVNSSGQLV